MMALALGGRVRDPVRGMLLPCRRGRGAQVLVPGDARVALGLRRLDGRFTVIFGKHSGACGVYVSREARGAAWLMAPALAGNGGA